MEKSPQMKNKDIMQKLGSVIDPELNLPITDMGLIYEAYYLTNDSVKITMTLTTIGCPLYDIIHENIISTLKENLAIKNVEIELTFEPPWTPEMMTDEAKMEIGFL